MKKSNSVPLVPVLLISWFPNAFLIICNILITIYILVFARKLERKHADVFICRGQVKRLLDWKEEAIADYDRAIELNPRDGEAFVV